MSSFEKILISVEGQTEEQFVKDILNPFLVTIEKRAEPVILKTKRTFSGHTFRGGILPYSKTRKEIQNLLADSSAEIITTLYDYYALPDDFPGRNSTFRDVWEHVNVIERAFKNNINDQRFIPHIQVHEFEALLFSDSSKIAENCVNPGSSDLNRIKNELKRIRSGFNTPEEIDDNPDGHPSKRIIDLIPSYMKRRDGISIAKSIGLVKIRRECPHFNNWFRQLGKS